MVDAPTDVRLAGVDDARVVAQLLHDFNTEFETETPGVEVLAERLRSLLAGTDLFVAAGERSAVRRRAGHVAPVALVRRPGRAARRALRRTGAPERRPRLAAPGLRLRPGPGADAEEMQINVDEVDIDARRFYERHGFTNLNDDGRMLFYERSL